MVKHDTRREAVDASDDQVAFGSLLEHLRAGRDRFEVLTGQTPRFCVVTVAQYEQLREELSDAGFYEGPPEDFCIDRLHGMFLGVFIGPEVWH